MHLKAMAEGGYPLGVLASLFRQLIGPLRSMCFMDNEYGDGPDTQAKVAAIGVHTCNEMNRRLTRSGKPLRVLSLKPSTTMQHHVDVEYERLEYKLPRFRLRKLKVNLYIPNASAPQADEEQEEGIVASGPRFSMTRLKGVARPRRGEDRVRRRQRLRRKALRALKALQESGGQESALEPKEKPQERSPGASAANSGR